MYVLFFIKEFLHFIYFKLHNIDTIEVLISNYISQCRTEPIIRKYLVKLFSFNILLLISKYYFIHSYLRNFC